MAKSWGAEVVHGTVTESSPGSGAVSSAIVSVDPDDIYHLSFERVDGGTTDRWTVEIQGSTDGSRFDSIPLDGRTGAATDTDFSIVVTGLYAFRIRIQVRGTTNTLSVTVRYRLGGD